MTVSKVSSIASLKTAVASGKSVELAAGTYTVSAPIRLAPTLPGRVVDLGQAEIVATHAGPVFEVGPLSGTQVAQASAYNSFLDTVLPAPTPLAADASLGQDSLALAAPLSAPCQHVLVVTDMRDQKPGGGSDGWSVDGELCLLDCPPSGSEVCLAQPLLGDYPRSLGARVYPVPLAVRDLTILGGLLRSSTATHGVRANLCGGLQIEGTQVDGTSASDFEMHLCLDSLLRAVSGGRSIGDPSVGGTCNLVRLLKCSRATAMGVSARALKRHAFDPATGSRGCTVIDSHVPWEYTHPSAGSTFNLGHGTWNNHNGAVRCSGLGIGGGNSVWINGDHGGYAVDCSVRDLFAGEVSDLAFVGCRARRLVLTNPGKVSASACRIDNEGDEGGYRWALVWTEKTSTRVGRVAMDKCSLNEASPGTWSGRELVYLGSTSSGHLDLTDCELSARSGKLRTIDPAHPDCCAISRCTFNGAPA